MILYTDTEEEFTAKCKAEFDRIKREERTGPSRGQPCISYLQAKSDNNDPVQVPQYERD